jgi:hypothetical protein
MVSTVSRTRKAKPERDFIAPDLPRTVPHEISERFSDPDLVDRIFDYIVQQLPEIAGRHVQIKQSIRDEFSGERAYVRRLSVGDMAAEVARMFNGRNASEVARHLQISRATVYRLLKQPGRR